MIADIENIGKIDLSRPIDLSISIKNGENQVNAFYIPYSQITPLQIGGFVGSTALGGDVNCYNVLFNPHGNGTHTECVGHISKSHHYVNNEIKKFNGIAELITVNPKVSDSGDLIISKECIEEKVHKSNHNKFAIIIRTLPNSNDKKTKKYSGQNPCYFSDKALEWCRKEGYIHFLTDLPSVDKEEDEGKLLAHHAWWDYPNTEGEGRSITELIYVPEDVPDGMYYIQICIAPFESDASPSRPLLYHIIK